jgi:hypothetical protein
MTLAEARLPDLLLDLHDQYGAAFPKPAGLAVNFSVFHENVTYQKAKAEIEALLTLHGVIPSSLVITPGPEVRGRASRVIKLAVAKDLLL